MESVTCILCEATGSVLLLAQRDVSLDLGEEVFTLMRCEGCGLIYLNPRPTQAQIHAYYPKEYYPLEKTREPRLVDRFFKHLSNTLKKGIMQEFYGYPEQPGTRRSGLGRIMRRLALFPEYWHLKFAGRDIIPFWGDGRILDVGCGPGKVMRVLRERGWDAYGVDFSPIAVEYARSKHGLNVALGDLFEAAYKDAFFDVVLFNHSLEHMYNPVETLQKAHRILKPGGLLLIYIPNAGSFEARLFGKWWVQWDVPRHLFHFTKDTIARLLSKTGFRLSKIKTGVGSSFFLGSVDRLYKYVFQINGRHGKFMRHIVADPICLLAGHLGYGSEMKIYAQKPFEL